MALAFVFGFDNFKESRKVDNYQSGSGYRLNVTKTLIDPGAAKTLYPVVDKNSYLNWTPLVAESVGSDIRTYSGFANDQWRLNDHLSFNIGARFDLFGSALVEGDQAFLASVQLQREFGSGFGLSASYSYTHAEDLFSLSRFNSPPILADTPLDGSLADRRLATFISD